MEAPWIYLVRVGMAISMGAIILGILMFVGMLIFGSLFFFFWMLGKKSNETIIDRALYIFNKNYTIDLPSNCNKIRTILITLYKVVYLAIFCGIFGAGIGMTGVFCENRDHPERAPHKFIQTP
jgi:hypothetical protein